MNSIEQTNLARQLLKASGNNLEAAVATLRQVGQPKKLATVRPAGSEVLVSVRHLTKSYKVGHNQITAIKDVSLEVYTGEFIAITGTSGSGKSTLLQLIGGLDKPQSGSIEVAGQNLAKLRDSRLSVFRNKTIGFIFQFFYLQPFLSLETNIQVPAMFARTTRSERQAQSALLAKTVGLADRLKHLPRELSGGQMQRAAIARALQNKPSLLLADEPTGNLDRANALAIFALFKKIQTLNNTTVIVVTHDLELAAMADRVIHMSDGAVV